MGDGNELQLLIAPEALLHMERPKGDCAVFTTLVCALLDCLAIPWEIVTVAVDPRQPGIYSHVYARAVLEDGRRLPLDASHGAYPGWEVPRSRASAVQVWDEDGNPIEDQDSGYRGLHGVNTMHRSFYGEFSGLGDDFAALEPTVDTSTVDINDLIPDDSTFGTQPPASDMLNLSVPATAPATSSAASTAATTSALSKLASQWTSIFGQVVAPTTQYVKNADGSVSLVTPAGSSAGTSLLASSSITPTTMLVVAALGVAALLLLSKK